MSVAKLATILKGNSIFIIENEYYSYLFIIRYLYHRILYIHISVFELERSLYIHNIFCSVLSH